MTLAEKIELALLVATLTGGVLSAVGRGLAIGGYSRAALIVNAIASVLPGSVAHALAATEHRAPSASREEKDQ